MINEHAGKATFAAFPVSDYTGLRHMADYPVNKSTDSGSGTIFSKM